jgi:pimeloyl-ACP methyl ester carboxylesterase
MTSMVNWYRAVFRIAAKGPMNPDKIALRRVRVPTLILWGENDVALSLEMARPSLDLCDLGELVTFPGATHWVQHDKAQAVNQRLRQHFSPERRLPGGKPEKKGLSPSHTNNNQA